jgi:hypothetical protein
MCKRLLVAAKRGAPGCNLAATGPEVGFEPQLQLAAPSLHSWTWYGTAPDVHLTSTYKVEPVVTAPTGNQLLIGSPRGRDSCHTPEVVSTRAMCVWSQRRMLFLLAGHGRATARAESTLAEPSLVLSLASSDGRELHSRHLQRTGFAPGPSWQNRLR